VKNKQEFKGIYRLETQKINYQSSTGYPDKVGIPLGKLLVLLSLLTLAGNTAFAQLLWSEEFNNGTSPDSTIWSYDLGASGWGNNELQEYTNASKNVRIEDGNLVIEVQKSDSGFTSARIRTEDKLTFKYGMIEARIKMPDLANGLWPAFWTLGNNFKQVGWPYCGELDIMEMGSSDAITRGLTNRWVGSTAHWELDDNHVYYGKSLVAPADLNDDYHIFKMNWTPTLVTTYLDDQEIWAIDITPESCTDCSEFHQPHFVILNMAVGGNFTGLLTEEQITATTPAEMLVDYVRISDNGFTEIGGSGFVPGQQGIGPEYSGSWYNESQSGHGFSMEFDQLESGATQAVIYWYTYDNQGNPIFMLGNGIADGYELEIQFQSPYGMKYGEFDPDSVTRAVGGTARFDFTDADNATFSYTPSDFSDANWGHATAIAALPLTRLFAIPVSDTASAPAQR
jgi:beta-glucanase (GH16 family)